MGADEAETVLPVELTDFNSATNENYVILNWKTFSETNNSGFNIERSVSNKGIQNWKTIGFVNGKGTTSSPEEYSFTDAGITSGKYNYRLKQIDYNGSFQYFNLDNEVTVGIPVKFTLFQNYPNPFNPATVINCQLPVSGFISLKIYDLVGKEIITLVNENQDAGYHSIEFNGSGLSSGVYFYKLETEGFAETKRMTLIK